MRDQPLPGGSPYAAVRTVPRIPVAALRAPSRVHRHGLFARAAVGAGGRVARRGVWVIALLVDTGVLVAAANRDDRNHDACAKLITTAGGPLIVPDLVVGEAGYLIDKYLGPRVEAAFLRSLILPDVQLEPLLSVDLARMAELIEQYDTLRLGATDASVIASAERLGLTTLATTDRRHFSVVRPTHVHRLDLVP